MRGTAAWVRISLSRPADPSEVWVEVVSQPLPGDVTYQEGDVKVAVARASALRLTGTSLSFVEFSPGSKGFALSYPDAARCRTFFRNLVGKPSPQRLSARTIGVGAITLLAFLAFVVMFLWLVLGRN